MKNKLTAMNSF